MNYKFYIKKYNKRYFLTYDFNNREELCVIGYSMSYDLIKQDYRNEFIHQDPQRIKSLFDTAQKDRITFQKYSYLYSLSNSRPLALFINHFCKKRLA
jgi:hypothetical protein